jgi:hypothetical protein
MLILLIFTTPLLARLRDVIIAARIDRGYPAEPAVLLHCLAAEHCEALQLPEVLTRAFQTQLRVMSLLYMSQRRFVVLGERMQKCKSRNSLLVMVDRLRKSFDLVELWFNLIYRTHKPLTRKCDCSGLREGFAELKKQHQLTIHTFRQSKTLNLFAMEKLFASYEQVHVLFLSCASRIESMYLKTLPVQEYSFEGISRLRRAIAIDEKVFESIEVCKKKKSQKALSFAESQWSFFAESLKSHKQAFEVFADTVSV